MYCQTTLSFIFYSGIYENSLPRTKLMESKMCYLKIKKLSLIICKTIYILKIIFGYIVTYAKLLDILPKSFTYFSYQFYFLYLIHLIVLKFSYHISNINEIIIS